MSDTRRQKDQKTGGFNDFKKGTKRKRRAKENQAMKDEDFDNIPKFKKSDRYNFF